VTQIECGACHANTDAPLCAACTTQLADALTKLPGLIRDLEVTVTRQARIGDTPSVAGQIEDLVAVDQIRAIPAALRSRMGRITLPATQLPVAPGAALLHRQVLAGVRSWAALIPGAPQPDVRRSLFVHRNRMGIRTTTTPPTDYAILAWLHRVRKALADRIRQLEDAGEIHAKAVDMVAAIEATIDRRDPDEFAGRCDATGVRIDQQHLTGPPCSGLWCRHETCDQIRGGAHRLSVVAGECGEELHAPAGATTITCAACGTRYDIATHRSKVADKVTEQLGTVREVAGFLRTLELNVTVDKIDGWLRRGRIAAHGTGPNGRLVKVGEVRAYAEQQAERAKNRRRHAEVMSAT
jgi:LSD1 subclass zinc finger protein